MPPFHVAPAVLGPVAWALAAPPSPPGRLGDHRAIVPLLSWLDQLQSSWFADRILEWGRWTCHHGSTLHYASYHGCRPATGVLRILTKPTIIFSIIFCSRAYWWQWSTDLDIRILNLNSFDSIQKCPIWTLHLRVRNASEMRPKYDPPFAWQILSTRVLTIKNNNTEEKQCKPAWIVLLI